ncbi:hypothetical protein ACTXT7_004395 [Hymenolepis weldensis]
MLEFCGPRKSRSMERQIKSKCIQPVRMWKCLEEYTEPETPLLEPRTVEVLTYPQEDKMYGIELISPEPFVIKYPIDSPIQAVVPGSVSSAHAADIRGSPVYRDSPMAFHRSSASPDYYSSTMAVRKSPSPQRKTTRRSHSTDKRSRATRRVTRTRPTRTRSFVNYANDEERETIVGEGGRYIYVNPEYIQRYHRSHGDYDSFSSSGTAERPQYRAYDVFEYDNI